MLYHSKKQVYNANFFNKCALVGRDRFFAKFIITSFGKSYKLCPLRSLMSWRHRSKVSLKGKFPIYEIESTSIFKIILVHIARRHV